MKILVFSDSHGESGLMADIIEKNAADVGAVFYLGDGIEDCRRVATRFAGLDFYMVHGNCDYRPFDGRSHEILTLDFFGKKFMLTHGHRFGVKAGYEKIVAAAVAKGVCACFFGHTHIPIIFEKNGILFVNPGCVFDSYAVVEIRDGGGAAQANIIYHIPICDLSNSYAHELLP